MVIQVILIFYVKVEGLKAIDLKCGSSNSEHGNVAVVTRRKMDELRASE